MRMLLLKMLLGLLLQLHGKLTTPLLLIAPDVAALIPHP